MSNGFAAPAEISGFDYKEALGHLLVFDVKNVEYGVKTALGTKDAVRATIHDIDAGTTMEDALVFPLVLLGSLRQRVGQKVLGTLVQGVAKPGQNAPWKIEDKSGDPRAVAAATAYLNSLKEPVPAAAASDAAPAAWDDTAAPF
jgi:hypothetical protein